MLTEDGFNTHIMKDHEPPDVCTLQALWKGMGKELNVGRNFNYAQDRYHSKKWDDIMVI